jgi:hypothetical protein
MSPAERFAEGCRAGRLDFQWDPEAGAPVWYPRLAGPGTGCTELEWRTSAGLGTVYSTTWVHRRGEEPANVALVDVDEGFRMTSRVEAARVEIGMRVRVTFDADAIPYFVAASS